MRSLSATSIAETLLIPDWPAPASVVAFVTTRAAGCSAGTYHSFNLAQHVGDVASIVDANRAELAKAMPDTVPVQWLTQVHGTQVLAAGAGPVPETEAIADSVYLPIPAVAGAILTADCLPVMFASASGPDVAVAHAGWRGLADGILERTVSRFADPGDVLAWLGPAIGPCHFEVGQEVKDIFLGLCNAAYLSAMEVAFRPSENAGKWMADIYAIARLRLMAAGVTQISGGGLCTFCDSARFYSYRRDGVTGRMASVIYRRPPASCQRQYHGMPRR